MKKLNVALALVALAVAGSALGEEFTPTPITTGQWVASKPGARASVPTSTAGVPITTGPWTPSKPGVRPVNSSAERVAITTGPWIPSKPAAAARSLARR